MSSNIRVERICEYCNESFIAKTTRTRYCSHRCNQRHYKVRQREKKIAKSNKETKAIIRQPLEQVKNKDFLTVKDTATLLNCSRQTIYTLINSGQLKAVNLKEKKTTIARATINELFGI